MISILEQMYKNYLEFQDSCFVPDSYQIPVADLHTKVSGAPPPNRTKFFRFYICFHQKVPV